MVQKAAHAEQDDYSCYRLMQMGYEIDKKLSEFQMS